jgi:hypothetical protein
MNLSRSLFFRMLLPPANKVHSLLYSKVTNTIGNSMRITSARSVIWQVDDEYEKMGNGRQKKRCRLRTKTTMLATKDSSSAGLRHLKRKHKIDKNRQRRDTSQTTLPTAFAAASTITNLVTRFKASVF